MPPKQIVERFVEHFNQADANALAALYTEDAINHQVANSPVKGREHIRTMFQSEFDNAEMTCIVENIFEDEDWPF